MTAFRSISPQQAIAVVESKGVHDAQRLIVDFAAAGLIKGYALVIETIAETGDVRTIRGAAISTDLWKRVRQASLADDVWRGGTLRLTADSASGLPEVCVTGVSFSENSLHRLVEHHGGVAPTIRSTPAQAPQPEEPADVKAPAKRRRPDPTAIPPGALLATVNQAMAALGLGRTKIDALMKDGRLVRRKLDGGTRIEVESIHRLAGS